MKLKHVIIFALLASLCIAEAYGIEISIPDYTADQGATVTATVNVDNASGIAGGGITIEYDQTILLIKDPANDVHITDLAKPLSPLANANNPGTIKIGMAAAVEIKEGKGALFEIVFQVKADAKGKSPIKITDAFLFDKNTNDLPVTTKNGSVTVKEPKPPIPPKTLTAVDANGKVDETITTSIQVDDLTGLLNGDIVLQYDPKILSIIDVKPTTQIPGIQINVDVKVAGKINITIASPIAAPGGKGAIINLSFKGLAVGESALTFVSAIASDDAGKSITVKTVNGKITVEKGICKTPVVKEHKPGGKILALQATYEKADAHGHAYVDIWSGKFTVSAGQFLEYQISMFSGNPAFQSAVDLVASDGKTLRDSGAKDQNGITSHPAGDISKFARDIWYHRKISLDTFIGKEIIGAMIATDSDQHREGLFRAYVDNIQITDGECILLSIYAGGDVIPLTGKDISTETKLAGTAGTKDFSVSIVGQTLISPLGKLTTTWGNIKDSR